MDGMGWFLFGPGQDSSRIFILSDLTGLYVLPRPYVYSKPRVTSQKSSPSLTRLHAVEFAQHDCSAYRHQDERDGRVVPSAAFASSLASGDPPSLPMNVMDTCSL